MEIKSLSNSALERFESCPLSYYHAYLNPDRPKQEGVTSFYAEYGVLLHFLVEMYPRTNFLTDQEWEPESKTKGDELEAVLNRMHNQLLESGEKLTLKGMVDIYETCFPLIDFPNEKTKKEYYDQGLAYIKSIPDMDFSKTEGLEQKFSFDLGNGCPPITGVIDRVERTEKGLIITDYKTSKPYSLNAALKKKQLPIYGMASWHLYEELPVKYRYEFVRFGKSLEVEIPVERLTQVKNQINFNYMQMQYFIKQGSFPPNYQDFYCTHFCGYTRLCDRYKAFNGGS